MESKLDLTKFALTSEESELLILLDELQDVRRIGEKIGRDPSGVSRAIRKLADKYSVIEKRSGRWQITAIGMEINNLNRNFIQAQNSILKQQSRLKIGTNREFAARVVAPKVQELEKLLGGIRLDLFSYENGVEQALRSGAIDVGFDCGRPADPLIRYKLIVNEPIALFCSKKFYKQYQDEIAAKNWSTLPHILCERLYPDRIMNLSEGSWVISSHVNDIAAARELAKADRGWALLPVYAVATELAAGSLVQMGSEQYDIEKYGVWWLRERKFLQPTIDLLSKWMKGLYL